MIVVTSMYPAFIRPYSRSDNLISVAIIVCTVLFLWKLEPKIY